MRPVYTTFKIDKNVMPGLRLPLRAVELSLASLGNTELKLLPRVYCFPAALRRLPAIR
jgi:hypothetical protein